MEIRIRRTTLLAAVLAALLFTANGAFAQLAIHDGDVLVATRQLDPSSTHDFRRVYRHIPAIPDFVFRFHTGGFNSEFKWVPADSAARLLVPSPAQWIFWTEGEIGSWDGVDRRAESSEPPYRSLLSGAAPVSNFVQLPSGHFVVAEQWSSGQPKLLELDTRRVVQERSFPGVRTAVDRVAGATEIALRADGCTLLYVNDDELEPGRIHQLNVCSGAPLNDFATLPPGFEPHGLRELPHGHVAVATDAGVVELDAEGRVASLRNSPGARHLALSPDAKTLWVAGNDGFLYLSSFDVSDPLAPASRMLLYYLPLPDEEVTDLAVVNEWKPWARPGRNRAARH